MASISSVLLFFLAQLPALLSTSGARHADGGGNLTHLPAPFLCHQDQAKALLQLKSSFYFGRSTTTLPSWQDGTDCCLWEGVGCDSLSGNVTVLDLNNRGLSSYSLDPSLFSITSLQRLDLSMNDFSGGRWAMRSTVWSANIPETGFESFTLLAHLNLSNSGLYGQIPTGIGKLINLLSLDLSSAIDCYYGCYDFGTCNCNSLLVTNLDILVANFSNLRELYLDTVDLSSSGEEWCTSLATSVPRLQVLSLAGCSLSASIRKTLSRIESLTVINLQQNYDIPAGPFPEFFMDFINLTQLQLSDINLEGWFPSRTFRSKNLRVLDLSRNLDLTGHVPNFSNASCLETLRLDGTNFSSLKLTSSDSLKSLKELSLDANLVSVDFLSSLGRLGSLCHLDLMLESVSELRPIFSWIGDHRNLTSLTLVGCNFSVTTPSMVNNFGSLRSLKMVECNLPRSILSAIGNLMDLQTLEVVRCTTHGSLSSSFGNLKNLRNIYIDLYDSGPMTAAIGNLTNLRNMHINGGGFSGPMPAAIGNLSNLRNMLIWAGGFSGPMPAEIGRLTNLKSLEIHDAYIGTIPYAIGQLKKLTWLDLAGCNFSGSIPSSIVNLTQLTKLDLSYNSLNVEIPPSVFTLPILHDLDLSWNQLYGPMRELNMEHSRLGYLDLSQNQLSGPIPRTIVQLTSLAYLDVSSNNLSGLVELTSFWRLRNLVSLHLSDNKLHVVDTYSNRPLSTYLSGPTELGLASCNMTGFPRSLTRIKKISYLDLSRNKISGAIPKQVWETWSSSLLYLNFSHNMVTNIQLTSGVFPFTNVLDTLDLSSNRLQGRIPMPKSSATYLDYSNNRFSSVLPNFTLYLRQTSYLSMSNNSLNGYISYSICNSTLEVLDLSHNNLSGPIPSCLIENGYRYCQKCGIQFRLRVLNLRENRFEGTFPSKITTGCALKMVDLHNNKIEGQLPRGLSNCTDLEILDFGSNQIVDTFPSWLRGLPELSVIILGSNHFYGTIGDIVGNNKSEECFPSLQIIDLASNDFSGYLRPEWFRRLKSMMTKFNTTGQTISVDRFSDFVGFYQDPIEITCKGSQMTLGKILTTFTAIDFSNNRLEGTIPESIGRLVSLRVLNMSNNAFTGKIPVELGGMTDLESLDLSCNQLSGEIPQELTDLTFLDVLNLSNNHLVGEIPQANQFSTFNSSSFEGNAGLCGPPLSKLPCGATPNAGKKYQSSHHVDVALFLFIGLGFGIGFAAAIVAKWGRVGRWFTGTARASQT